MTDSIDPARWQDLTMSLGDDLDEIIETFFQDTPVNLQNMEAALANGDQQCFQRLAHSLKSTAAVVGATQMVALCRDLEQERVVNPAILMEKIAIIRSIFIQTQRALNTLMAARS